MKTFIVYVNPGETRKIKAISAYQAWQIVRKSGCFWVKRDWVKPK